MIRRVRGWVLRHLPPVLMEFPFEAFCAVFGALAGALVLFDPTALDEQIVHTARPLTLQLWGATLLLAGGTLAVGMTRRFRLALWSGLRLLAAMLATYAVALVWLVDGVDGWANGVLIAFIAALAAMRSLYLRFAVEVQVQARRERGRRGPH